MGKYLWKYDFKFKNDIFNNDIRMEHLFDEKDKIALCPGFLSAVSGSINGDIQKQLQLKEMLEYLCYELDVFKSLVSDFDLLIQVGNTTYYFNIKNIPQRIWDILCKESEDVKNFDFNQANKFLYENIGRFEENIDEISSFFLNAEEIMLINSENSVKIKEIFYTNLLQHLTESLILEFSFENFLFITKIYKENPEFEILIDYQRLCGYIKKEKPEYIQWLPKH